MLEAVFNGIDQLEATMGSNFGVPFYFWCLSFDFTSTSKRTVDLSSLEGDGQVNGVVLQHCQVHIILERSSRTEEV